MSDKLQVSEIIPDITQQELEAFERYYNISLAKWYNDRYPEAARRYAFAAAYRRIRPACQRANSFYAVAIDQLAKAREDNAFHWLFGNRVGQKIINFLRGD
jgi:hypothetical protein